MKPRARYRLGLLLWRVLLASLLGLVVVAYVAARAEAATAPDCAGLTGRQCFKAFVEAGWAASKAEVDEYSQGAVEMGTADRWQGVDHELKGATGVSAQGPAAGVSVEPGAWELRVGVTRAGAESCPTGGVFSRIHPGAECELPEGKATEALIEDGATADGSEAAASRGDVEAVTKRLGESLKTEVLNEPTVKTSGGAGGGKVEGFGAEAKSELDGNVEALHTDLWYMIGTMLASLVAGIVYLELRPRG